MKKKQVALILLVCLSFFGCSKGPSTSANADVYVAGFDNGKIVYWKNGKETILGTAAPGYYGNAWGLAVLNGDVYVSGYVGDTAVYWKNSIENYLSMPDTGIVLATSIVTSGSDIYIAGYGQTNNGMYFAGNSVLYWKNGMRTVIETSSNLITSACIAVSGNNVYIAATIGNDTAVYWQNGIRTTLASHYGYANSIALMGSDVFVAGTYNNTGVYWKNGVATTLTATGKGSANAIAISGSDIYIAGADNGNAVYWKNGTETMLGAGIDVNAIAVSGEDVYIAGSAYDVNTQTTYACYWKNGSRVNLVASPSGTQALESGNAIVVIQH